MTPLMGCLGRNFLSNWRNVVQADRSTDALLSWVVYRPAVSISTASSVNHQSQLRVPPIPPSADAVAPDGANGNRNAAQQAAIAIAMKKAGKKPKHVKEYDEKLGAAELPFTNGQLVRLKKIKDRLLGNKYKIINILHGGDRVRIVNQRTGKPLTVRFDDIVSLNENTKPLQSQLATLESGYVQARKATKAIKYLESEVQQIVVQVQQIAKQSGVDMQAFESAATEVSQAFNSLESSVYGLDETFKDQISSIQSQIDDSESLDEDDSDHQFSRKSIKESAESIEKLRKAIMNRILAVDDELFDKYGEVALGRAIDEVSEEYGDNQEQSITDADITAFTKEVLDRVLAKDNKIEEGPSIFSGGYSGGAPRLYKAKPAGLKKESSILKGLKK